LLGTLAVIGVLSAWAVFGPRQTTTDNAPGAAGILADVRSIAYSVPAEGGVDHIFVRDASAGAEPELVATVPHFPGFHARGSASPLGDRVAVLSVTSGVFATLSLIDVTARETIAVPGSFDYLSALAWSADGGRLAAVQTATEDGTRVSRVFEVDTAAGATRMVAEFRNPFAVAPVGYSIDGERLFVVVVDETGSHLWERRDGEVRRLAELSPGRTRDWALSPGGSRLAFIDVLGAGSRTYVGRVLTIATGTISTQPAEKDQIGAAWEPGSPVPVFGGPGGALALEQPGAEGAYVVPLDWAPAGDTWVATVIVPGADRTVRPQEFIELQTRSSRERIAIEPGSSFFGWVRDLD
jgi:Tol biopolymer transport system component